MDRIDVISNEILQTKYTEENFEVLLERNVQLISELEVLLSNAINKSEMAEGMATKAKDYADSMSKARLIGGKKKNIEELQRAVRNLADAQVLSNEVLGYVLKYQAVTGYLINGINQFSILNVATNAAAIASVKGILQGDKGQSLSEHTKQELKNILVKLKERNQFNNDLAVMKSKQKLTNKTVDYMKEKVVEIEESTEKSVNRLQDRMGELQETTDKKMDYLRDRVDAFDETDKSVDKLRDRMDEIEGKISVSELMELDKDMKYQVLHADQYFFFPEDELFSKKRERVLKTKLGAKSIGEDILLIYDETLTGSAKSGFVLTKTHLYVKTIWVKGDFSFDNLVSLNVLLKDSRFVIQANYKMDLTCTIFSCHSKELAKDLACFIYNNCIYTMEKGSNEIYTSELIENTNKDSVIVASLELEQEYEKSPVQESAVILRNKYQELAFKFYKKYPALPLIRCFVDDGNKFQEKKAKVMQHAYTKGMETEKTLLIFAEGMGFSIKKGLVLTDKHIYHSTKLGGIKIPLEDIQELIYSTDNKKVFVNNNESYIEVAYCLNLKETVDLANALADIIMLVLEKTLTVRRI